MTDPTPKLATAMLDAATAAANLPARAGTIYLLHFDRPYRHAGHYTGWTTHLDERLLDHELGLGARLTAVVAAAGISWTLARTWQGTRSVERALKRQGSASRRCPLCGVHPRTPNGGNQ